MIMIGGYASSRVGLRPTRVGYRNLEVAGCVLAMQNRSERFRISAQYIAHLNTCELVAES